ncbi:hypothetical protein JHK82_052879 [Glycine max]|nr:hypothetical protein JHK86_052731 [Glycine max]KAG4927099.1 hypothetical protein JHK85_053585 [Glycine max]KAG5082722.1 hypothetical protein JHK84_052760 [Glycine max]KAG5085482.1 hypothetical protein JHK82_052879 [Glycine max]
MTMQSTTFSWGLKEGRGDTSVWTDTPLVRAQKAKMNYLEAYNEDTALASNEEDKKRANVDVELVDKYNKAKRSKTLVQKYQEVVASKSKKKPKELMEIVDLSPAYLGDDVFHYQSMKFGEGPTSGILVHVELTDATDNLHIG